jgi:hypothetical protein
MRSQRHKLDHSHPDGLPDLGGYGFGRKRRRHAAEQRREQPDGLRERAQVTVHERLRAIAQGRFWMWMYVDDHPIGSRGNGGSGEWQDQIAPSAAV